MLFIIAGSAGAGKTTIISKVIEQLGTENIKRFPTCTTRQPRQGEVNGKDYYFLTPQQFKEHIKAHDIIEAKKIYGNLYGTNLNAITSALRDTKTVIKDFDVEGCMNVKKRINYILTKKQLPKLPVVTILVDAPDDVLVERMRKRNDNTNIEERQKELIKERVIKRHTNYDYIVTNDDLQKSVDTICDIIKMEYARAYNKPLLDKPLKTKIPNAQIQAI